MRQEGQQERVLEHTNGTIFATISSGYHYIPRFSAMTKAQFGI